MITMGKLEHDLKELGYEPTDRDSPFDDNGKLWTNSYELVCDETGFIIRKDERRWTKESGELKVRDKFKYDDIETV